MLPKPTSYPTQNTHRVVLFRQDVPATDFDQLEVLTADALAKARDAIALMRELPWDIAQRCQCDLKCLEKQVERRRVLTDDFRNPLGSMLHSLARADVPEPSDSDAAGNQTPAALHDQVMRALRDALNLSTRVSDLVAAEQELHFARSR